MQPGWHRILSSLLLVSVAASCAPGPTTVRPTVPRTTARASASPGIVGASLPPVVSSPGTVPVIQPSIGTTVPVIANNGAGLIGKVKAPAQLISDKGLGLIGNNSGSYRLLALTEAPVAGAEVLLKGADGQYIKNDTGEVLKAISDATGAYRLPFSGNSANLVVEVRLPENKGALTALVPRGQSTTDRTVDVNFTSTLVMTYILDQYVKGDPKVLDKLPADVELTTRTKTQLALEGGQAAVPEALTSEAVVATVNLLRTQNPGLNDQLEVVKKLLLAGLSDQGSGYPANQIETDASDVAIGPDGLIYFAGLTTVRIWKKDFAGNLAPVAGSGVDRLVPVRPTAADPAPGDGGPAKDGLFLPQAFKFLPDGRMLILDMAFNRVRMVDTAGMVSTYAASDEWDSVRDMALESDGSLVVATHSAIYRVKPDKSITLIAGEKRTYDPNNRNAFADVGDGGPPTAARFKEIQGIASGGGAVYVYDYNGRVRRFTSEKIEAFAGTGQIGFSGDGGPATSATLHRVGAILVQDDGSVLIADSANHRVRQVKDGVITTVIGNGQTGFDGDNGPPLSARITEPRRMFKAPNGALYIVDAGFIRKLENGILSTPVGGLQSLKTKRPIDKVQFMEPGALAYEEANHALLVCDSRHVYRWTLADNMIETIASSGPAGVPYTDGMKAVDANLVFMRGPLVDTDGSIHFAATDYLNYVPRVLTLKNGTLDTLEGGVTTRNVSTATPPRETTLGGPETTVLRFGDTYYYNAKMTGRVRSFTIGGTTASFGGYGTSKADGTLAKDFDFTYVTGMAKTPDGDMLVADLGVIYRIDMDTTAVTRIVGTGVTGFGGDGGPARDAQFLITESMVFDKQGRMYFSDSVGTRIRRVGTDGIITTVAGLGSNILNGTQVDTGLLSPVSLAFDKDGNLYVADVRQNQVKIIRANQL
jgi:sugar lactone lactonase YvrE